MSTTRIPLFPLEVVLLPESVLPLHIFEPRYREMTRHCIENSVEFGVVRQREHGVVAIGCTAEITQTLKEYEDGRFDLLTIGRRPFRIQSLVEEKSYYEAEVEFLRDEPAVASTQRVALLAKFAELHQVLFGQPAPTIDAEEVDSLAYVVGAELPLELDFKQVLLETRSESERQRLLLSHMEDWLPIATRQQHIKKIAGGNGHGLH